MQCECSNRTSAGRKKKHQRDDEEILPPIKTLKHLIFQTFFPLYSQFCTVTKPVLLKYNFLTQPESNG